MQDRSHRLSRRKFLASAAGITLAGGLTATAQEPAADAADFRTRPGKPSKEGRKPLAVVTTVYRPLSHAFHIAGRFLHGYPRDGQLHVPKHHVASIYVEQKPDNDVSRCLASEFDVRHCRTIEDALTAGTNKLAVEAVLLIGEHGNYPPNDKDQILYPRHKFLKEVVDVFRKTGQAVPVFNDKHLSYSWAQAQEMAGWARELKFPFMAGSSLPVTWRRPELELPLGCQIEDALVAAYGPVEVYGFHALETLQCMVERRHKPDAQARDGANQGVKAVTCLTGKDVWKAGDDGLWSWSLLEAALGRSETLCPGDVRLNTGSMPVGGMPATPAIAFLVEYRDGLRGAALLLNGHIQDFNFAAKVKGEDRPQSCLFALPPPPGAKFFDGLVANIEKMLESGKPPYPVERTLLTGGVLDFAMESRHKRGTRVETPELDVMYQAPADSGFCRGSVAAPI
jgi:hypothetical protein